MAITGVLTPTSYAVLGLLAIQPWTTYELAKQMDRTLNRFWPRARSKLYEEPKKLVAEGLAVAETGAHGRRPRTVYSITPKGRQALRAWLSTGQLRAGIRIGTHSQDLLRREWFLCRCSRHPGRSSATGCTN